VEGTKVLAYWAKRVCSDEYDEVTISNIKEACTKHFSITVGNNMTCDILAGE
jgi:hypothetical protein